MGNFFNMDNPFFSFMGKIADLAILNFLCIICCIPIVTAGASITAMYYVTLKMVRNEESYIIRSFWKSFRQNLKQGIFIQLIVIVISLLLYADFHIISLQSGSLYDIFRILLTALAIFSGLVLMYVYPVLSKFYNTTQNIIKNSLIMSIKHLPFTFLMALITVCPVLIFFVPNVQVQAFLLLLLVVVGFSSLAYIKSIFFVRIFDHYIPEETVSSDTSLTEQKNDVE